MSFTIRKNIEFSFSILFYEVLVAWGKPAILARSRNLENQFFNADKSVVKAAQQFYPMIIVMINMIKNQIIENV